MTGTQRWLILCVVLTGTFMVVLDNTIVNVAIPSLRDDLHATFGQVAFAISAYTLTYACLLVTGGRLGDNHGRRRLFVLGLLVFAAASAACGLAGGIGTLIAARAVQGVGSALMYPQVLAIIQTTFPGEDRAQALGIFGAVIGIAAIAGQIVGGTLLALDIWGLEWRPIFFVNVPVALAAVVAAFFILPRESEHKPVGLDWGGVALLTPTLLLFIIPLLEGRDQGWPIWMIVALVASFPLFFVFIRYERRFAKRGGRPLVRIELFANRSFSYGLRIAVLFMTAIAGFQFTLAIFLQVGLGFSPLQSGVTYTPFSIGFFIASLAAPRFIPVLGRYVLSLGYLIAAFGLAAAATTAFTAGLRLTGLELAPPLLVAGLGFGLGMSPLVGTVISGLPTEDAGSGAGIATTTLQVGVVLGIALIGLFFFTVLGPVPAGTAYSRAIGLTLPVVALLLLAAAWLVKELPRMPFEASNALIERLPGWSAGFAYSMFLMTGGRMGDRLVEDLLAHVADRRISRAREAPLAPGEFLAFHYREGASDVPWLRYLMREALVYGGQSVPHEGERKDIIATQVEEVRQRQHAGVLPADLDAGQLRLLGFALVSYPRMLPQITRMATGMTPDDPRFIEEWTALLREVGGALAEAARQAAR